MTQNLHQMTAPELKQYLSAHRNDPEAFRVALTALISRRDPNLPYQPYPFSLDDPEDEVKAILMKKLEQAE